MNAHAPETGAVTARSTRDLVLARPAHRVLGRHRRADQQPAQAAACRVTWGVPGSTTKGGLPAEAERRVGRPGAEPIEPGPSDPATMAQALSARARAHSAGRLCPVSIRPGPDSRRHRRRRGARPSRRRLRGHGLRPRLRRCRWPPDRRGRLERPSRPRRPRRGGAPRPVRPPAGPPANRWSPRSPCSLMAAQSRQRCGEQIVDRRLAWNCIAPPDPHGQDRRRGPDPVTDLRSPVEG
jgi:hypothetical protein